MLTDTAIVGHLGRSQLAALGLAATVLTSLFALFNFLQYGTTAQVARADGSGRRPLADALGVQAAWLSVAAGVGVAALTVGLAAPVADALGAGGTTADYTVTYLRIAALGLPFAFLALGAQGYLRGLGDLRTPLVIVVAANVANVFLELLFVYGFDWGIAGSAWGTVLAQVGMGAAFAVTLWHAVRRDPWPHAALVRRLLVLGRHIFVRTAALLASFVVASAVLARMGDASLGAHQIAFQLWIFLALVLDAIAIAGQVIVGRRLGAADADGAFAASARMIWLAMLAGGVFAAVLLAVEPFLPLVFTGDELVLERTHEIWWLFALMQPLNGAVFALDGILIGAGDGRYLMWSMVSAFAVSSALSLAALALDWGIVGVWCALVALILVRLATLGARFATRRWLVTGWA